MKCPEKLLFSFVKRDRQTDGRTDDIMMTIPFGKICRGVKMTGEGCLLVEKNILGGVSADDDTVLNTCCFCDVTITLSGPFEYGGDANC